ncbi:hypothetical protein [Nocardia sp. NPDC003979]
MSESGGIAQGDVSEQQEHAGEPKADGGHLRVLTKEAVKAGLVALKAQRIHEHFPAYLLLRQLAITSGSLTDLNPDWKDVSELLKMPGGPPTKPHYRPFSSVNRKDESGYWYNRNLAGSYAPKSMRVTSRFMLNASGDHYELPADHVQQALMRLLKFTKVPAWALAAYYLRNYGFAFVGDGGSDELIAAFKEVFAFDQGTDFDALFDVDAAAPPIEWFEPFSPADDHEQTLAEKDGPDA